MLFFDRIKKRFSYIFLMRVAAIFFTVKITLMYLAGSMGVMYAAQACQVLGYGLMFPAMVSFIDDIMSRGCLLYTSGTNQLWEIASRYIS